jgi:hypothetical protein
MRRAKHPKKKSGLSPGESPDAVNASTAARNRLLNLQIQVGFRKKIPVVALLTTEGLNRVVDALAGEIRGYFVSLVMEASARSWPEIIKDLEAVAATADGKTSQSGGP